MEKSAGRAEIVKRSQMDGDPRSFFGATLSHMAVEVGRCKNRGRRR